MGGLFSVGVLLIIVGVLFLFIPLDMLRKVFRRMRSKMGTRGGGGAWSTGGFLLMPNK